MNDEQKYPYPFPEDHEELAKLFNVPGIALCWSHYMVEGPITEGTYYQCGECGHLWQTAEHLIADHNIVRRELKMRPYTGTAHHIYVCAHDF